VKSNNKRSIINSSKKKPDLLKFKSQLQFITHFPKRNQLPDNSILIIDKNLLQFSSVKNWLKSFSMVYPVEAGENLKQLKSFEKHLTHILKLAETIQSKNLTLVAIGGGSVGDFIGFIASVFKRGTPLIHIPSTWLAAIDSSHGGKTALNIGTYKNQIGTFYPAQKVILCKQLLFTQPPIRTQEALGEIIKTALLSGGKLWREISKESTFNSMKLWNYLPQLIAYKYRIVLADPFEKKGIRYILNLGHTFGHTFELYFKMPHGNAVNLGLLMALGLSNTKNVMKPKILQNIIESPLLKNHLISQLELMRLLKKHKNLYQLLSQDKKISQNGCINFVYLKAPGKPVVLETRISELSLYAKKLSE